jgi:formylglycine-generating enzyme required for sulfatase activity
MILDVCRKDAITDRKLAAQCEPVPRPQKILPPRDAAVLFSCSAGQTSEEQPDLRHSTFAHYFTRILQKRQDDRQDIAFDELHRLIRDRLDQHARDLLLLDGPQKPVLVGKSARPFLLAPSIRLLAPMYTNSIGMTFRRIPAGKFRMGSPKDEPERRDHEHLHEVEITRPFFLGVYEVTQKEYKAVTGNNPSYFVGEKHPVESVSWEDATAFCEKLSDRPEEKRLGHVYRLPTEAEWEYACRAGDRREQTSPFYFHEPSLTLDTTQANFDGNFPYPKGKADRGPWLQKTVPVGSYVPNAWGLYDMHGNVSEWCSDWYDSDTYKEKPRRDPSGPATGITRIVRGGSWCDAGWDCRAACRLRAEPQARTKEVGFRVVLMIP